MLYERYTSILEFTILSTEVHLENLHSVLLQNSPWRKQKLKVLSILTLQGSVLLYYINVLSTTILYVVSWVVLELIHLHRFAEVRTLSFAGRE